VTRRLRIVWLAGGIAVLALVLYRVGLRAVLAMLQDVGWAVVPVAALYAAHVALRALALWRTLPDGCLSFNEVLRVRLAGEAVEVFTFTGPWLAEPAKGWLLTRRGLSGAHAFACIALEYLLYSLVAGWMAAVALAILLVRQAVPGALSGPIRGIEAIILGITLAFAYAVLSGRGTIVPTLNFVRVRPLAALASRIEPIENILVGFLSQRRTRLAELLVWQGLGHGLLAAEIAIMFHQLGMRSTTGNALIFEGAAKFISVAFFFVPGQLGAQEGVYSLIATALGVSAAAGLTVALARRIRNVIVALAGLGLMWLTSETPADGGASAV
jgi:hypothetical protein